MNKGCSKYLATTVLAYRVGMEGLGSDNLTNLIDCIMSCLCDTAVASIDPGDLSLLEDIVAAQRRRDHIYIADLLEFKLRDSSLGALID